uniref:phospholipid phosphatase-related protein type 3-like n=1 Tax=Oncorhynchus gorbuscha TaxID=8017 RepID=UPI001EAF2058|nr:phospholipid phosphatase-related protein type 3-like [Oncorhynchus gorbuscha]
MMSSPKAKTKKKPSKDRMTLLPCFYFIELPIVLSSLVSLYFMELTDLLSPATPGFHCYDRDLSLPYLETGDELIPLLMLLSLAFAGPAASIMLGEGLVYCYQSRVKLSKADGCNFNSFLRRTVRFVGVHVFGLLATALMTDIIQLATGYPTPFFLTVCQPNYTLPGISCDQNNFITQDICSGKDLYAILSARKTFPSQHATLSGFAAVYISMYLNSVISSSTKLVKPVLVFGYCLAAGIAGLTQITQHRCHPRDVYVGYALGAGIGVYLSLYAVGNFRSSEEDCLPQPVRRAASPPQQQREVVVRGRAQRGHASQHGSLYRSKTPRPSDSREELGTGRCKVRREKASVASLKRASADVELLAPRGTMGKETMVTFSNTLPRVANGSSSTSPPGDDPSNQRHMTFHLSFDPRRSQPRLRPPLVQEWRQQRSVERRSEEEGETDTSGGEGGAGGGGEAGETGVMNPPSLYPTVQSANRALATATPAPAPLVHIPKEGIRHPPTVSPLPPSVSSLPPPVSPKSAVTRAKLMSLSQGGERVREGPIPVTTPRVPNQPPNQPRVAQVIAMSKQHGPICSSAKGSDSASSCGGGSSTGSSESPYYRVPSDHDSNTGSVTGSIVTIDAHAPHHPVVRVSSSVSTGSNGTLGARVTAAGNGTPWERRNTTSGSVGEQGQRGALQRQEKVSAPDYREYRTLPVKSDSICSSSPSETDSSTLPPPPHPISSPLPPFSSSTLPPPPQPTSPPPASPFSPFYSPSLPLLPLLLPLPPPPHPDLLLDSYSPPSPAL